ncbi:MAG: hypothetical protein HOB79_21505 [Rhodospirillaceae bacterium]|jgi:hypothetical protein|nr:hypothetical protein [Rhodospirillales bacterium]MBT3905508.1 hypothetical protein [Rhodospirillaceae bacterium]MBT4703658.1 hypothetical protein [Rhodospirillaceae bacterium]MBT5035920.1 hypothetical protein [Rhodospirillaceae bacterium]MBT6220266.1 hypothetical protein [Rhodospirillaceae bacterium]
MAVPLALDNAKAGKEVPGLMMLGMTFSRKDFVKLSSAVIRSADALRRLSVRRTTSLSSSDIEWSFAVFQVLWIFKFFDLIARESNMDKKSYAVDPGSRDLTKFTIYFNASNKVVDAVNNAGLEF